MLSYLDFSIIGSQSGKIVQSQSLWELLWVFVSECRIQVLTSYSLPICNVV